MHLGIPLLGPILHRTGGNDDGGIDHGAPATGQALCTQIRPDPDKQLFPQSVRFQQMPKLADGLSSGNGFAPQINAHKLPHGMGVIEGFLDRPDLTH